AVIGGFMLLATDPFKALLFVIITFVLQTIDGYIIKPRLFGNTLGVPAIIILMAIVIGGKMFGVIGILLAIPFAAIVTLIYKDAIIPYLTRQTQNKRTIA
ncbi:MAG: AI-2E family transporter, partial [Erysipelotrichaceae bacterium]|nr:AI-2E family transporter [Erysipelotrichaceae bacterium]